MKAENGSNQIDDHVLAVVRSAGAEIHHLLRQRAELMKRIGTLKQTLAGLAELFGEEVLDNQLLHILERKTIRHSGFTHACRTILMNSPSPMSARQVRDQIRKKFPGLIDRHKDPLASVTTVLSRLAQYSEARCQVVAPGRRVWQWSAENGQPSHATPVVLLEEKPNQLQARPMEQ